MNLKNWRIQKQFLIVPLRTIKLKKVAFMSTKTNTQIQKKENDEKDNFHKLKNNKG